MQTNESCLNSFRMYAYLLLLLFIIPIRSDDFIEEPKTDVRLSATGYGWDYLEYKTRYPALKISFNEGRRTNDQKYLIPDCMIATDNKKIIYEGTSEIIESGKTFTSISAKSFSIGGGLTFGAPLVNFSFGGSFSNENQNIRAQQEQYKSVTVRTQYIDNRYSVISNSRCSIDDLFRYSVEDIGDYIQNNDTVSSTYYTQVLLKEFGTHYMSKVDFGATIFSDDQVTTEYYEKMKSQNQIQTIKYAASFSLFSKISFSVGSSSTNAISTLEKEEYKKSTKFEKVDVLGGTYTPGLSVSNWVLTLENNLVPIDREGELITTLINSRNFPNINTNLLSEIRKLIDANIKAYLRVNSKIGCMTRDSANFDPTANVHGESSCKISVEKIAPFGGIFGHIYKKVISDEVCWVYNTDFASNLFSCPSGYTGYVVFSYDADGTPYPGGTTYGTHIGLTQCIGTLDAVDVNGVLFGGIYSPHSDNPVTGSKSCPPTFKAKTLYCSGQTLNANYGTICTSRSIEESKPYSVTFGGFIAECSSSAVVYKNPLSNSFSCPTSFEKVFAFVTMGGCELYYCAKFPKKPLSTSFISLPFAEIPLKQ